MHLSRHSRRVPHVPSRGLLSKRRELTEQAIGGAGERRHGVDNLGFASFRVGGTPAFYRMNFLTGEALFIDVLGDDVVDVALPLDQ